ncbi:alpha/beta fold hydrolase [Mucilaginibacter sp.]|uniref:alpha/beta fold hydrolase n=1 Tax=Mucilaginibacter sp. TaxID=1882438 RepID=UPI003D128FA7
MKLFIITAFCIISSIQFSCVAPNKTKLVRIMDKDVNIAYTDTSKGDTTLLFVHGWCINRSYWANQVNYFSKKYRVVTIDLPGFGQSGKNRNEWNMEAYSRDVNCVITQLHLKKVILIGHSMAGDIVLQAAANATKQVIGLVGVDNFKGVGGPMPSKKDTADYLQAINELKHHFKKVSVQYVTYDLFYKTTPDSIKKRVLADVAKADSSIATAALMMSNFDEVKTLIAAKQKLYLINSDIHKTDTTGLAKNHIPFLVKYVHATGHFPMIEKPAAFNAALGEIIKEI